MKNTSIILTLLLLSVVSYSQVKYTSTGNFGIGTTTPLKQFTLKNSNPYIFMDGGSNATCLMRFTEASPNWYGGYIGYRGNSNLFVIGMHNTSTASTDDDVDFFTLARNNGNIDFYPSGTSTYDYSFDTHAPGTEMKCYVVTYSGSRVFFVRGDGEVHHSGEYEISDASMKSNVENLSNSMSLIKKLRPVSYQLTGDAYINPDGTREKKFGLIAQEVEEVIPEIVSEWEDSLKCISYTKLIPLLIDAVKSHQNEIEDLKEHILDKSIESTKKMLTNTKTSDYLDTKGMLYQNSPNPFNQSTCIRYFTPDIESKGMINIYDLQGKQLKTFQVYEAGEREIQISSAMFDPGIYIYNLIIDNKVIDSKQMILTQ